MQKEIKFFFVSLGAIIVASIILPYIVKKSAHEIDTVLIGAWFIVLVGLMFQIWKSPDEDAKNNNDLTQ